VKLAQDERPQRKFGGRNGGGVGGAILLGEALSIIGLIAAVLSSAVLQPNRRRPRKFRPWVAMPL
jgi:hypothetical protein